MENTKNNLKWNKYIDTLLTSSELSIDVDWGLKLLSKYISEISLVSEGIIKYSDLNYSEKRQSDKSKIIYINNENNIITTNFLVGANNQQNINSSLLNENIPNDSIAYLKYDGVMQLEDSLSSKGINSLVNDINLANQNKNISNILLELNSGGGESISGFVLNSAIKDSEKPVWVWSNLLASAALNGASAAKGIYLANKSAQIGSIGSMVSINKDYINWYKENIEEIYSSKSGEKNIMWRELLSGNKEKLIKELDNNVKFFHENILNDRNIPEEYKKSTLNGSLFYAEEGIDRGLADGIKSFKGVVSEIYKTKNYIHINDSININNKKENNMNFQNAYKKIISVLNDFFKFNLEDNAEVSDFENKIKSFGETFEDAVAKEVSKATEDLNNGVNNLQETLKSSYKTIESMKAEIVIMRENIKELNISMEELKELNKKLENEKADLENKIVEFTNNSGEHSVNNDTVFNESGKLFMDKIGNIAIEGNSQY